MPEPQLSFDFALRGISIMARLKRLLSEIADCTLCSDSLPQGPRPVVQAHARARILIAGQAPGRRVHETGVPFDDPSGDRLREWMGVSKQTFYDAEKIAIAPMGFCYPGTGKTGDLPPRPECAEAWRAELLAELSGIKLTLVLGSHAVAYHLPHLAKQTLTATVESWKDRWPKVLPTPHPSPRNNRWLKRNPWFEDDVIPALRKRVRNVLRQ
jgi:uracil-DNA glycosylase